MKKIFLSTFIIFTTLFASAKGLIENVPYLQNPTDNGITVTWLTSLPAFSYVEYGTDKDNLQQAMTIVDGQVIAGNTVHNIRLKGIEKGIEYYYRITSKEIKVYQPYKKVFGDSVTSQFYKFKIPTDKSDYTAIILNDLHKRNNTVDKVAALADTMDYNLVIFNGDCIDDPKDRASAMKFVSHLSEKLGKGSIPFIFIRGNHEIRGAYSIFLREIIEYSTERSFGGFSWGDTRYVILDCGEDKPDNHWVYYGLNDFEQFRLDQVDFLKQELKSKPFKSAGHKVLVHHIPIYESDAKYNPCYDLWHPMLKNAPFTVAITGHTHAWAYHSKGSPSGNNFPLFVGGGYNIEEATIIAVRSRGKSLSTTMYDMTGKVLAEDTKEK